MPITISQMRKKEESLKDALKKLHNVASSFTGDKKIITEKHDVWSAKKLLVLRYYIEPFLRILRNNNYQNIHYVDPFSGSGFFNIDGKLMPGTPLIPLLKTKELFPKDGRLFFNSYHVSDEKKKHVDALSERIPFFANGLSTNIDTSRRSFKSTVYELFSGAPPIQRDRYNDAYLVVLDPYGFDVEWELLNHILRSGAVDVILTFHSALANWTKNKENSKEKLSKMYGGRECLDFDSPEEFVKKYCEKIKAIPVSWHFKTKTIIVPAKNQTYYLICISRSDGALGVFSDMQAKFDQISQTDFQSLVTSSLSSNTLAQWFDS